MVVKAPLGGSAPLTVGLPDPGNQRPDPNGVITLRTSETRSGWVPSIPRGLRCPSGRRVVPQPSHAVLQRPVPEPRHDNPPPRLDLTRHHQGFTDIHPSDLPQPVTLGWSEVPWAFSRASHPAVTSDACRDGDRHVGHLPELRHHQLVLPSYAATRCVRLRVAPTMVICHPFLSLRVARTAGGPSCEPRPLAKDGQNRTPNRACREQTWDPADNSGHTTAEAASAVRRSGRDPGLPTLRHRYQQAGDGGPEALPPSSLPVIGRTQSPPYDPALSYILPLERRTPTNYPNLIPIAR